MWKEMSCFEKGSNNEEEKVSKNCNDAGRDESGDAVEVIRAEPAVIERRAPRVPDLSLHVS